MGFNKFQTDSGQDPTHSQIKRKKSLENQVELFSPMLPFLIFKGKKYIDCQTCSILSFGKSGRS